MYWRYTASALRQFPPLSVVGDRADRRSEFRTIDIKTLRVADGLRVQALYLSGQLVQPLTEPGGDRGVGYARHIFASSAGLIRIGPRADPTITSTPAAAFATSSCPMGGWSIESRPPRAVRRSRAHNWAVSRGWSSIWARCPFSNGNSSR